MSGKGKIKLTPLQDRFCHEYIIDYNGSEAAKRAGSKAKQTRTTACEWLTKPHIQERIEELRGNQSKRLNITADRILEELAKIAFMDIVGAFDEKGNLLPIHKMPEDVRRAIGGLDVSKLDLKAGKKMLGKTTLSKIKLIDKRGALELLGKHEKLWSEKVEVDFSGEVRLIRYPQKKAEGEPTTEKPK